MNQKEVWELNGVQEALKMSAAETRHLYRQFLNPVLADISRFLGANQEFVRAEGLFLYDRKGKKYIDFLSGFGVLNFGHEHPHILKALRLVENRPNIFQSYLNPLTAKLASLLADLCPGNLTRSFFCSSGAEAVEAALKIARISTGKSVLLHAEGAYHGKTYGALSVSGREKYKKPFLPLLPDVDSVPFDDVDALEQRLSKKDVAAFILEPIQGENGVVIPREGYLKKVREICTKHDVLLILDEIQTGFGRTGRNFACEHEDVVPDVLVLSKSLGGGVMPIGAIVTTDKIWKKAYGTLDTGLLHSTTFGSNTRACACGIAAIEILVSENLAQNAYEMGKYFKEELEQFSQKTSLIEGIRGKGLMLGISLKRLRGKSKLLEGGLTMWLARQLLQKHGIVTAFTLNNLDVLRIAPPLTLQKEQIDFFIKSLREVLQSAELLHKLNLLKD